MEKAILYASCVLMAATSGWLPLAHAYYGKQLCKYPQFSCVKIKKGDTWEKRWPDSRQRDMIMRLNRTNLSLEGRSWVVVPKNLNSLDLLDLSPFPGQMATSGKKMVLVDTAKLAFGAYDEKGHLIYWGPASGGKDFCPDIQESCTTPPGTYWIQVKRGADCFSSTFPVDTAGGAPMPYCMFFYQGYALHGSEAVPGYNASHGCVRLYPEDAQWLSENFTSIGTKVVIKDSDAEQALLAEQKSIVEPSDL
jgi:L,D-transpeptidase ErfK/SrfK